MASATNKHMNLQQQNVSYNRVQTLVSLMVGINEALVVLFLQKSDDSSGYLKGVPQPVSLDPSTLGMNRNKAEGSSHCVTKTWFSRPTILAGSIGGSHEPS